MAHWRRVRRDHAPTAAPAPIYPAHELTARLRSSPYGALYGCGILTAISVLMIAVPAIPMAAVNLRAVLNGEWVDNGFGFFAGFLALWMVFSIGCALYAMADWLQWKRALPILEDIERAAQASPETFVDSLHLLKGYAETARSSEWRARLSQLTEVVQSSIPEGDLRHLPLPATIGSSDASVLPRAAFTSEPSEACD